MKKPEAAIKRKTTVLAIMSKYNIHGIDLRSKILELVFPKLSTIEAWLEEHGVPMKSAPAIWSTRFSSCILNQEGTARAYWLLLSQHELQWAVKACHTLDVTYQDLSASPGRVRSMNGKDIVLSVPQGWFFDADRQVKPVKACVTCDAPLTKGTQSPWNFNSIVCDDCQCLHCFWSSRRIVR